jgi:nickel transport system substrate-binding protein
MNTWYGALMAGEYDLTFYNTAGGSFDPATDMSNMAPGAMGDPILCQFSAFFENPEIFAELDSTSDSQRVQEIYGMILNGIADQNLLVPVTGTHDLALWNTDKITGYDFYTDASYVDIASVHVK